MLMPRLNAFPPQQKGHNYQQRFIITNMQMSLACLCSIGPASCHRQHTGRQHPPRPFHTPEK
jgi:hypothetical protein